MGYGQEYYKSKFPLKLAFVLMGAVIVNLLLIFLFQLTAFYRYTLPLDAEQLTHMNRDYEGCTVIAENSNVREYNMGGSGYIVYLLEDTDGGQYVAVLERHSVLDRYRYLKKISEPVPEVSGTQILRTGNVIQSMDISITDNARIDSFGIAANKQPGTLLLLLCAMCIVEYLFYCLLFKRHEILS